MRTKTYIVLEVVFESEPDDRIEDSCVIADRIVELSADELNARGITLLVDEVANRERS